MSSNLYLNKIGNKFLLRWTGSVANNLIGECQNAISFLLRVLSHVVLHFDCSRPLPGRCQSQAVPFKSDITKTQRSNFWPKGKYFSLGLNPLYSLLLS